MFITLLSHVCTPCKQVCKDFSPILILHLELVPRRGFRISQETYFTISSNLRLPSPSLSKLSQGQLGSLERYWSRGHHFVINNGAIVPNFTFLQTANQLCSNLNSTYTYMPPIRLQFIYPRFCSTLFKKTLLFFLFFSSILFQPYQLPSVLSFILHPAPFMNPFKTPSSKGFKVF